MGVEVFEGGEGGVQFDYAEFFVAVLEGCGGSS